jgi:hypothetical protein
MVSDQTAEVRERWAGVGWGGEGRERSGEREGEREREREAERQGERERLYMRARDAGHTNRYKHTKYTDKYRSVTTLLLYY